MRRLVAAGAAAVAVSTASGCGGAPEQVTGTAERVLVISVPGVTWADVDLATMPILRSLADRAAVANLATAVGRGRADTAGAYLTMGAGTRAVAEGTETGVALGPGELVNGVDSTELLGRRFGEPPTGISYPAAGPVGDRNADTVYGADIGLLGDELAEHGIARGVVANADQPEELAAQGPALPAATLHREAVTVLMRGTGTVPEGSVSSDLLEPDPTSAFGVRLDVDAAVGAFRSAWRTPPGRRAVVLVEASDLRRTAEYARLAQPDTARRLREATLRATDDLIGRLLQAVDPQRDAVLVVGIPTAPREPELGVAILATPGGASSLLRSATTGRDGYVQLADVAPAILDVLGEDHPRRIEGRPFVLADGGPGGLVDALARDVSEASFRDRMVPGVTIGFIAALAALLAAAGPWSPWAGRYRSALRFAAFAILGAAAGTFLAGIRWLTPDGPLAYAAVVLAAGLAVAGGAAAAERRWPGSGVVVALGTIVAVVAVDVGLGATLQVNTVFGYSVAVAGRFTGLGNLAFAIFSATAVLLAAVLTRRHGPAGIRAGIAVLAAALLIDGFPLLGADVGGSLAMVPAFGVTALVLSGRAVRWLHLFVLAAAGVAITLTFALVDLARPEHHQTHLARFARLVLDGRWPVLADSLSRRLQASFGGLEAVAWGVILLAAGLAAAYVVLVDRDRVPTAERRRSWPRPLAAAGAGLLALALLGWTTNDSSYAVPATMLIVVVPVLVDHLLGRPEATR